MREQDKLRNTLRDYYDTQEAAFHEREWEQASAYLNSARKKRKLRVAGIILVILLSGLGVAIISYPGSQNKENTSSVLASNSDLTTSAELSSAKLETAQPKTESETYSKQDKEAEQLTHNIASAEKIKSKEDGNIQTQLNINKQKDVDVKDELIGNDPVTANISSANISDDGKNETVKQLREEDTKGNEEVVPGDTKQITSKETKEIPQELSVSLQQVADPLVKETPKKETAEEVNTVPSEVIPAVMPETLELIPIVSETTAREIVAHDTFPPVESFTNLAGEGIFYEAGAAWLYGWKGPEHRDARGFSPLAGINYMNRVNKHSSLSFGVQYLQVPKLSNSSKTSRVSSYKYGEQNQVTVITPSTLHYLVAPLRFHYYVNWHTSFGGGFNLAYLLNVDAKVTTYDENPGYNENYKTIKLSGYTEGFSWYDSQLALFYNRKIGNSIGVQLEVFMGLTDVKQDEFFGFNNKERNSGAKLSLIYYAFRKNNKQ